MEILFVLGVELIRWWIEEVWPTVVEVVRYIKGDRK